MDQHNSDNYWVEDPAYRVEFTSDAITYFQKKNGQNNREDSLRFRLTSIEASDTHISFNGKSSLTSEENRVTYSRTPLIKEVYEVRKEGIEQSWIIDRPLTDKTGDLIINGELSTKLSPRTNNKGGIDFLDEHGVYVTSYGKVIVIDNSGKRITLSPQYDDERLTITIPAKWMEEATYPVVVDPILGADIGVATPTATNESYPAVAFDGTNYLVVYQSGTPNGTGTGTTDINGIRVSGVDGTIVGTTISIAATASRDEEHPSLAYDPANTRYIVVWERWNSATSADILLNTVTAGGALGSVVSVSAGGTRILAYPSIACCDATNAYVVWGRANTAGSSRITGLRGALINKGTLGITNTSPSGTLTNSGGPTSSPTTAPAVSPKIIFTNTTVNRYLLVWENFADTNGNLSAQIYTVGTGWGTQWSVAATGALLERYPALAFDGTNFLVSYQRGATGGNADIYGQFVTTAGANQGGTFSISATAGQDEVTPALTWVTGTCSATPVNRYLAVWGQGTTIQARPVTTASVLESTITVSVNTASAKSNPAITSNEGGCQYFVSWSDNRNGGGTPYDIYAQRVGYPNITDISPPSGYVGTTISINGDNFGPDPGAGNRSTAGGPNKIMFDGTTLVPDSNILVWTDTPSPRIDFTIPAGTTPLTYSVTVTAGSWTSNSSNLTVNNNALQITTASLPNGYQWISYGSNVSATGGTAPYSWSIVSGNLPAGLTLDSGTGLISGTASNFGTFNFTVRVTDSATPTPQTADQPLSILIYELTTITVTPANPTILQGQNVQFTATGTFADMTTSDITSTVTWGTTNPSVATVNSTGLATGTGLGAVSITATK